MWIAAAAGVVLAASSLVDAAAVRVARAATSQENCAGVSFDQGGNWFCRAVGQVTYSNYGQPAGQYDQVVGMDQTSGQCQFGEKTYSGPLAPFDEPLSLHFRGPIYLRQLAVYMPRTAAAKKREEEKPIPEPREKIKRDQPTVWVTATIDGQVVSWVNNYGGPEATPAWTDGKPAAAAPPQDPVAQTTVARSVAPAPTAEPEPAPTAPGSSGSSSTADGFVRTGYYNSQQQVREGLTFLGNYGGTAGSGNWTSAFGNTLSYVNALGTGGSPVSTTLSDTTVPSGHEFAIMTDQVCDDSCGYVQPGSVAYKGFDGADKTFLVEFSMPHEPDATGAQADMPSLWLLNARIPYTMQYGQCSCWASGCGEFDVFEVLSPGDSKCKSTLHAVVNGGDPNYFDRPAAGTIKVAVVFDSASGTVTTSVLANSTEFSDSLTAAQVLALRQDPGTEGMGSSLFQLG